eukprot:TRINITY_DN3893_c0_g1_i3.p1 TRINITY_DN3893_c0_g1~~TRINITY_DN3893_c0_g1_i3.p1  ORF type:complete len:931 (+),score=376.43 TRINITY_DN3893_c0_g1_i3:105-2897(+)
MSSNLVKEQLVPSSDELNPLEDCNNYEKELQNLIAKLNQSNLDWEIHFESLTKLRRIIIHHSEGLLDSNVKWKGLLLAILSQIDNLRSLISRNGIQCLADLFQAIGKQLDGEIEGILPKLLRKYSDSKFFEEESDSAIFQMIRNSSSTKLLSAFIQSVSSKNAVIRGKLAMFITRLITTKMGASVLKFKDLNRLIQALSQLNQDASPEARAKGRQALFAISGYHSSDSEFDKLLSKSLSSSEAKNVKEALEKIKKEESIEDFTPPSTPTKSQATPSRSSSFQSSPQTPSKIAPPPKTPTRKSEVTELPSDPKELAPIEQFHGIPKVSVVSQDMEESITVCVRLRPLDEGEKRNNREVWKAGDRGEVICSDVKLNKSANLLFDLAYGANDSDTSLIYEGVGAKIIDSVMNGYNGTIFAYGQTNSGKTYTMMGNEDNPGIIPHAIEHVFTCIKENPDREYLLRVSYLEIYNEVVNDLLRTEGSNLPLRDDKKKGLVIDGLKEEIVVSPEHVIHVINSGEAHRHVASTDYNLISSRSHTIFRMIIESNLLNDTSRKNVQVSALTLIDLAGSEKVVSTSILRKREGAYINKSLLTLGTIISKLSERKKGEKIGYLPYRDSKLTRILEASLSGNARIAIIATASVASGCYEETNNTLKFATRAKKITHKATVNQNNEDLMITKYKAEIDNLKHQLQEAQDTEHKLQETQETKEAAASSTPSAASDLELDRLRNQLADQENMRISLEEKIKQLTKLILVSSNVPNSAANIETTRKARSFSLRVTNPDLVHQSLKRQASNLLSPRRGTIDQTRPEITVEEQENQSFQKMNQELDTKIQVLQEQEDWRDKQIAKLKQELKEKDQKIEALLNGKLAGSDKSYLDEFKSFLSKQYEKTIEDLKEELLEKDTQIQMQRADNNIMAEKITFAEQMLKQKLLL